MKLITFLLLLGAGGPAMALEGKSFVIRPFALALPARLDRAEALKEWTKTRTFCGQEKLKSFPRPFPKNCKALSSAGEPWIYRVSASATGGKFAEIDYVRAVADCWLLKDLTELDPSPIGVVGAAQELLSGKNLSGDFFPQLPPAKSHFAFHLAPSSDSAVRIELVYDAGGSEALPPNRTYHLMATGRDPRTEREVWLAVEETIPGNYGMCSYVRIEKTAGDRLWIRDRKFLGRCG